jgi:hypothetical protein
MVSYSAATFLLRGLTLNARDSNVSNIAAGYIINSPSQGIVRAYVTSNSGLQSSVFNYANVTDEGLVDNIVTSYSDDPADPPTIWRDYVNSNFPIFEETVLVNSNAVFTGLVERRIVEGPVAAVRATSPSFCKQVH